MAGTPGRLHFHWPGARWRGRGVSIGRETPFLLAGSQMARPGGFHWPGGFHRCLGSVEPRRQGRWHGAGLEESQDIAASIIEPISPPSSRCEPVGLPWNRRRDRGVSRARSVDRKPGLLRCQRRRGRGRRCCRPSTHPMLRAVAAIGYGPDIPSAALPARSRCRPPRDAAIASRTARRSGLAARTQANPVPEGFGERGNVRRPSGGNRKI